MSLWAVLLGLVAVACGLALLAVQLRWRATTRDLVARLRRAPVSASQPSVSREAWDDLPTPVARYLSTVLGSNARAIVAARLRQRGSFLARPGPDGWRPFVATQFFTVSPPGFVWDARIRFGPGMPVFVRDAFLKGAGLMRGALLGAVPMLDVHGTPEIAAAALQRYLAEAAWFPTALLSGPSLRWISLDESSARATLTADAVTVSLDFRFGEDGLVRSVYAAERFREVAGTAVLTPWEGRWLRYGERGGMLIPLAGEVAWLLPEGRMPYWRGELTDVSFERAGG